MCKKWNMYEKWNMCNINNTLNDNKYAYSIYPKQFRFGSIN